VARCSLLIVLKLYIQLKDMAIKFLTDYPALFIQEKKTLVITDLHLGLEYEFYKSGIVIPSQGEKFQKTIDKLIKTTKAKTLVILGDIKHKVPGISFREEREIPKFLNHIVEKIEVVLTIGNHDTELKEILPKEMKVYSSRGFKIGKYGFFHGHAWPSEELMQCDYLFMGHMQPSIEFRDKLGYYSVQQIWLKNKLNQELIKKKYKIKKTGKLNIIVVPSFNMLSGSLAVNKTLNEELIGPLLTNKILDVSKSSLYLLDGTYLGTVKKIKREF
jgi:putative SbcD/Mre11-related phosphoesterase